MSELCKRRNRRNLFATTMLLALASSLAAQTAPSQPTEIPPVVLEYVFRHVKFLKQRAEERVAKGVTATKARDLYKEKAQLSQAEADTLETAAITIVAELDALDARAAAIIKSSRPAPLNRRLLPGEKPPGIPPELMSLQKERNNAVAGLRERLRQAIGAGAFSRLEQSLLVDYRQGALKPTVTVLDAESPKSAREVIRQ